MIKYSEKFQIKKKARDSLLKILNYVDILKMEFSPIPFDAYIPPHVLERSAERGVLAQDIGDSIYYAMSCYLCQTVYFLMLYEFKTLVIVDHRCLMFCTFHPKDDGWQLVVKTVLNKDIEDTVINDHRNMVLIDNRFPSINHFK